ncbi:MAG: Gfo/Idh/MocA family oxidoreductase [Bacteroidales bacterium]|nr:Gfo/Idh/MocA family oxidoreductase [Bacteroidales bacterium]MBO4567266.1 Gfo/Idh/MocA family oxidoreductase [Bacteroidales bacterium]
MKQIFKLIALGAILATALACSGNDPYGYTIKNNQVVYNTPPRPADQQSMLGFKCDPIENVRVGFIGLGMRGPGAVERFCFIDDATIVALCDLYEDRVESAQQILDRHGRPRAEGYWGEEGYKELCAREDIDLVYLAVPWQLHTPFAVYAMEHGKHVAIEVPAATSIKECWDLVNTSERTRKHCMMLENCCYDFFELTCLNMAQHGLFGEIVHVEGSYCHNLDPYWDYYQGDWRMTYNREHHGDCYPTHGIGPVCQDLNIHRGDKMDVLVAMDTDAFKGQETCDKRYGEGKYKYANGDNTSTLIRTRNGKTILVEHAVVTPRPYSRMYQVMGTEGFANKYPNEGLALGSTVPSEVNIYNLDAEEYMSDAARDALMVEYQHPITKEGGLAEKAKTVGGHGGMDFIMDYRLIYCLHNGLPLDQDVYDAAEWSSLVELTEVSINNGSMPVVMPDFTRGEWNKLNGINFAMAE